MNINSRNATNDRRDTWNVLHFVFSISQE